jgi:trk system potassium uptake protein TrkA
MKTIVVGCGRLGSELAGGLARRGHEVSVIDSNPQAFHSLPPDFHGRMIEGDALNQDVLHRAGIVEAEALASVTSSDALNLTIGHLARTIYDTPIVVARNYGPNCRDLFDDFNLQMISSSSWGAKRVEEMMLHSEVRTVFSAGNGEVVIYELVMPEDCNERPLQDLLGGQGIAVSITRAGRAVLPEADFILKTGDVLHISTTFEGIEDIRSRICPPDGRS